MEKKSLRRDVFHIFLLDGKFSRRVGTYLNYWDKVVEHRFTQREGVELCPIRAGA